MLLAHMPQGLIILTNRMGWDNWRLSAVVITVWTEQLKISTALNVIGVLKTPASPATMRACSFLSPSSLLPSSGPNKVIYFLLYDAMEWVMSACQKGPRFLPFFRPLPVSLLFQLHCRGGRFIHVTWRSHNGTKIKCQKNLFRCQGQ